MKRCRWHKGLIPILLVLIEDSYHFGLSSEYENHNEKQWAINITALRSTHFFSCFPRNSLASQNKSCSLGTHISVGTKSQNSARTPGCWWSRPWWGVTTCLGHTATVTAWAEEENPQAWGGSSVTASHRPVLPAHRGSPRAPFSQKAAVRVLIIGLTVSQPLTSKHCTMFKMKGKSWCAVYPESGAVISLKTHVHTPGEQGQAVTPAPGEAMSTSCQWVFHSFSRRTTA